MRSLPASNYKRFELTIEHVLSPRPVVMGFNCFYPVSNILVRLFYLWVLLIYHSQIIRFSLTENHWLLAPFFFIMPGSLFLEQKTIRSGGHLWRAQTGTSISDLMNE